MSRRHAAEKREILPDAKFGDRVLTNLLAPDLIALGMPVVETDNVRQTHGEWLTRLFVRLVRTAVRAELLDLKTIRVVATVLLGDVVTVLAHLAGQGDLRPYVGTRRHVSASFASNLCCAGSGGEARSPDLTIMSRAL